ncbi:MAG: hypothetical protein EOS10_17720 [Mesorhizobium sp.]|uniref:hypothetical protein n=1 Tax=Mesorhizobium sp. TaxID=1871066 RepID=UPI000FE8E650|nr:hypothetical protein [Mesorhizobium sp.]RWO30956.1 MAG: hypothetical protein EOS10_17720 [Mesorhizobium sp.]
MPRWQRKFSDAVPLREALPDNLVTAAVEQQSFDGNIGKRNVESRREDLHVDVRKFGLARQDTLAEILG